MFPTMLVEVIAIDMCDLCNKTVTHGYVPASQQKPIHVLRLSVSPSLSCISIPCGYFLLPYTSLLFSMKLETELFSVPWNGVHITYTVLGYVYTYISHWFPQSLFPMETCLLASLPSWFLPLLHNSLWCPLFWAVTPGIIVCLTCVACPFCSWLFPWKPNEGEMFLMWLQERTVLRELWPCEPELMTLSGELRQTGLTSPMAPSLNTSP